MTETKRRPPQIIGVDPAAVPSSVTKYAAGVQERAKAAGRAVRQGLAIPNLAQADSLFDPKKDRPMTMTQMAEGQEVMRQVRDGERQPQLKPETVAGLAAMSQAAKEKLRMEDKVETKDEKPKAPPTAPAVREALDAMDDLDLDAFMQRVRSDIINNEKERLQVESRLTPMAIEDGLATGEYTQVVPIIPEKFTVTFRSVSHSEISNIRKILFKLQAEDPRIAAVAGEQLGLMTTVASIARINGESYPTHADGKGFDEELFMSKVDKISRYPSPMIHSLSVHSFWFDQRVRKLFTSDALKNG